jgi:hypothetical protein
MKRVQFDVLITDKYVLDSISSGSAIAVYSDSAFIIGDDANYVSVLNIKDRSSINMLFKNDTGERRIPKPLKHDFESCVIGEISNRKYLLAFGSGGISPMRDSAFTLDILSGESFTFSLGSFYNVISKKAGLGAGELNFEGATISGNELLLFNRGKNFICVIPWNEMVEFIFQRGNNEMPSFSIIPVALPVVNGFQVGFSGACTMDNESILFTASLEETTNFIDDGAVKGSYIGIIKKGNDSATILQFTQLKDDLNRIILDKLESIDIYEQTESLIRAICVADNDNGSSTIFMLEISR